MLCLDDILGVMEELRTEFNLSGPCFGLEHVERVAVARKALSKIIEATEGTYGRRACSKQHLLLEHFGPELYSEEIQDCGFPGYWRLSPSHVVLAFRRIFEIALQTLFQLPSHDPRGPRRRDELVSLASQLGKLAKKVDLIVRTDGRLRAYPQCEESAKRLCRLRGLSPELWEAGEFLISVSSAMRVATLSIDSPNPQVRFALYLAGWIEKCTGRKHYKQLQILAAAAFAAGDRDSEPPKWIDRLEIEMHRRMMKRRRWAKMNSSKS